MVRLAEDNPSSGRMPFCAVLSHLAFVKFTWNMPLLIIKQLALDLGAGAHKLVPPGPGMCLGGV